MSTSSNDIEKLADNLELSDPRSLEKLAEYFRLRADAVEAEFDGRKDSEETFRKEAERVLDSASDEIYRANNK